MPAPLLSTVAQTEETGGTIDHLLLWEKIRLPRLDGVLQPGERARFRLIQSGPLEIILTVTTDPAAPLLLSGRGWAGRALTAGDFRATSGEPTLPDRRPV
jgi:hypothetical protein